MNYQLWFKEIYENVFCKTYSESYYVFLCGGAGKDCIRDKMRALLEKHDYQILYPEDLFIDVIYHDKKADLLDYENLLAQNADAVCVICESPGSFAELGAFVQSDHVNKRFLYQWDGIDFIECPSNHYLYFSPFFLLNVQITLALNLMPGKKNRNS